MPSPRPAAATTPLTRRAALSGVVATTGVLWAGCTTDGSARRSRRDRVPQSHPDATATVEQDPDIAVAASALANERAALDALTATLSRHPGTRRELAAAVDAHRAHISLLAEAAPPETTLPGTASPGSTSPEITSSDDITSADITVPERVPGRPAVALARIVDLEQELSISQKRHAFAAQSGPFARLLASMAASAAQLAAVLTSSGERA